MTDSALDEPQQMQAQAERIRVSSALGRSGVLARLFEFLLRQSLAGHRPKELEIAVEVFGKSPTFDVSQDATIRVYIHKLRRKLEEHYDRAGSAEPVRIVIPKGEYRLTLEQATPAPVEQPETPAVAEQPRPRSTRLRWLAAVLVASVLVNVALVSWRITDPPGDTREFAGVRDNPMWSRLLDDDLPVYIVVGDYFIFAETDNSMNVQRLVREFDINSPEDLQQQQYSNPELSDRYLNLDLSYLPVSSAFALRSLLPVLATKNKRVEVVLASNLDAHMIKSAHIIYIGFLSGMGGMLQDLVLAPSRFSIGQTYDELVDTRSKQTYMSQAGTPVDGEIVYHDYGFVSSFTGPNDNQVLIVAGTRDTAVMHMAETLTSARALSELSKSVAGAQDIEALYEVSGLNHVGVKGRLVVSSAIDARKTWSGKISSNP